MNILTIIQNIAIDGIAKSTISLQTTENMLRKISIAAQKKLPTFGAALRFNDEVKEILRGAND